MLQVSDNSMSNCNTKVLKQPVISFTLNTHFIHSSLSWWWRAALEKERVEDWPQDRTQSYMKFQPLQMGKVALPQVTSPEQRAKEEKMLFQDHWNLGRKG